MVYFLYCLCLSKKAVTESFPGEMIQDWDYRDVAEIEERNNYGIVEYLSVSLQGLFL